MRSRAWSPTSACKQCMILRNHGLLTTAPTVADAFLLMYVLETACQIQIMAQSSGGELVQVPAPIVEGIQAQAEQVTKGLGGALDLAGLATQA